MIHAVDQLTLSRDVLLIIPTHRHALCLPLAIASAQQQSVEDIDIVVIGDGVGDDTRDAISPILAGDQRVRFVDLPKGARNGEQYRDAVIRKSAALIVTYLGDDDLFFPHHVETMTRCIDGVDFANPLPIFIRRDGRLDYLATNLADPMSLAWHLDPVKRRNSVSLTGATHTRRSYLALPHGWRPDPADRWSDHYMWEQYFQLYGFTARTALRATTAKFADSVRADMTPEERAAEVRAFAQLMAEPGFTATWNARIAERIRLSSVHSMLWITELEERLGLA